jgi:hypothetical protein
MTQKRLLAVDAGVNLLLGALLSLTVPFPARLPRILGVPAVGQPFYASMLGAVLIGIGVALLVERGRSSPAAPVGLGLMGAIAINLCAGVALFGWLVLGGLDLSLRGAIVLWSIDALLLAISGAELATCRRSAER